MWHVLSGSVQVVCLHGIDPPEVPQRYDVFAYMSGTDIRLKNRELSWLSFNHRVLQEAANPRVPLYERVKFLAIFSSNLDEFFRVRVAALRSLLRLKKKSRRTLGFEPARLLKRIHSMVLRQQETFGQVFRKDLLKALRKENILLVTPEELDATACAHVREYVRIHVMPHVHPISLQRGGSAPFLENKVLYLCVRLRSKAGKKKGRIAYALLEIPTKHVPRFLTLPDDGDLHRNMFLDDAIRLCLSEIFPGSDVRGAFAIKLTRDAELELGDEFEGDLVEKVRKALAKRSAGIPCRLLYDAEMPRKMLRTLARILQLEDDELVEGSRYHNFNDLMEFPNPVSPRLTYEPMDALEVPRIPREGPLLDAVARRDALMYFPYHSYEPVLRTLAEAADDTRVRSIHITLYRAARGSRVIDALARAAANGKAVTAFVEVKARFDEESNLRWAEELRKTGVTVLYSLPGLKVHAKLCLVTLADNGLQRSVAYMSTGNFNESAARVYTDFGLLTSDGRLTREVAMVFDTLERRSADAEFHHLLVAPFTMRERFQQLIEREVTHALEGRNARIIAKMNSLEDPDMIALLYKASCHGVKIDLIVRGICCLVPGIEEMSENIKAISIVDRFLEHARVFVFHNDGNEEYYLASADWMRRNLDRRIEVAFPIYDPLLQKMVRAILDLQLSDSVKARIINKKQDNPMQRNRKRPPVRSQFAIHDMLKRFAVREGEPLRVTVSDSGARAVAGDHRP